MRKTSLIVALALKAATAEAQDMPSEAVVSPITKAGIAEGCSVQYTAVSRDHVYKAGAPIGISGSLAWMLNPKAGVAIMFKLIAADIDGTASTPLHPFRVVHAFARINDKVVQVGQTYSCDQPTGFCGASGIETAMETYDAFAKGGEIVSFGLNRTADGMDVLVPVPSLNLDQNNQFNVCMLQVLQEAKRRTNDNVAR